MNLFIQFKNNGTNETVMIETGIYLLWNFFQDCFSILYFCFHTDKINFILTKRKNDDN